MTLHRVLCPVLLDSEGGRHIPVAKEAYHRGCRVSPHVPSLVFYNATIPPFLTCPFLLKVGYHPTDRRYRTFCVAGE